LTTAKIVLLYELQSGAFAYAAVAPSFMKSPVGAGLFATYKLI
jgi:hypothetical protein